MNKNRVKLLSLLFSLSATSSFAAQMSEKESQMLSPSFQVTIQSPQKTTINIETTAEELVEQLKQKIEKKGKVPIDDQKLLFEGEILQDEKKLSHYLIKAKSIIDLLPARQAGAATFDFSSFGPQTKVMRTFTNTAPKWRTLTRGLNIEGTCKNQNCEAFDKKVWVQKGFGKFNMAEVCCRATCPMKGCNTRVKNADQCGFFHCKYKVEGEKENGSQVDLEESHIGSEGFAKFLAGGENSAKYKYLNITVTKHWFWV